MRKDILRKMIIITAVCCVCGIFLIVKKHFFTEKNDTFIVPDDSVVPVSPHDSDKNETPQNESHGTGNVRFLQDAKDELDDDGVFCGTLERVVKCANGTVSERQAEQFMTDAENTAADFMSIQYSINGTTEDYSDRLLALKVDDSDEQYVRNIWAEISKCSPDLAFDTMHTSLISIYDPVKRDDGSVDPGEFLYVGIVDFHGTVSPPSGSYDGEFSAPFIAYMRYTEHGCKITKICHDMAVTERGDVTIHYEPNSHSNQINISTGDNELFKWDFRNIENYFGYEGMDLSQYTNNIKSVDATDSTQE